MSPSISPVGDLLKEWRGTQGMSQLDLALAAGVSSRHISFVETGRSQPSRTMVLRLAETLDVPLRERNAMLVAAGFAPVYRERPLQGGDLGPVQRALETILASHEPYPAFVLDRSWDILLSNEAHRRLLPRLLEADADPGDPVNVARLVLHPDLIRAKTVNWEVVAHVLGHRIRRQLREPAISAKTRDLFEEVLSYPGVREAMVRVEPPADTAILVPMIFDVEGARLSWFSTIATIGTPQDITVDELRIESLFPADDETAASVRAVSHGG